MPLASSATATVSPARAVTVRPSTMSLSVGPVSASLLNMKPPRTEGSDQGFVERAAGDHGRDGERLIGAQRHARVAAHGEGPGMALRLVIDREAVLRHDADSAPGAHDIDVGQQREL